MSARRNISRRDFLKAGSAGAALLGVGLAAGCSGEEGAATGSPDSNARSGAAAGGPRAPDNAIAERFTKLTRETEWRRADAVPVAFRTYHPQGMTRVGMYPSQRRWRARGGPVARGWRHGESRRPSQRRIP
jgi:hypothetical protein